MTNIQVITSKSRRDVIKLICASLGSTLTQTSVQAATDRGLNAPRVGLVIGNSQYHDSPLSNPGNDARSMTTELKLFGFDIQTLTDAKLKDLFGAVEQYTNRLAKSKGVGLFYYAGHGVQLGWRNYLIPVDANIDRVDDIPKQAFDLNLMLTALGKAQNPMNIIIIDACRDNPFGKKLPIEQKGLSQVDAPAGSLLCYATAPGNVASDGAAGNGLFTENLLREMRNPDAKIEDVLKRVRLNVRLKSNSQQIPWESSSLEGDFYFNADNISPDIIAAKLAESTGSAIKNPVEPVVTTKIVEAKKTLSEEEIARRFKEESALWDEASKSPNVKLTEQYIRTYPNGSFSELAQARLDLLLKMQGQKKVVIINSAANPFTKGSASGVGRYAIGDRYNFIVKDYISGVKLRDLNEQVTQVSDSQIVFDNGSRIIDLMGNEIKSVQPRYLSPVQLHSAEYSLGKEWNTRFGIMKSDNAPSVVELNFKVTGREMITTPAGSFNAFVVNGMGYIESGGKLEIQYWIDPDKCNRPLRFSFINSNRRFGRFSADTETIELVAFSERRLS